MCIPYTNIDYLTNIPMLHFIKQINRYQVSSINTYKHSNVENTFFVLNFISFMFVKSK